MLDDSHWLFDAKSWFGPGKARSTCLQDIVGTLLSFQMNGGQMVKILMVQFEPKKVFWALSMMQMVLVVCHAGHMRHVHMHHTNRQMLLCHHQQRVHQLWKVHCHARWT